MYSSHRTSTIALAAALIAVLVSCASQPEPAPVAAEPEAIVVPEAASPSVPVPAAPFDPASVTVEMKQATFFDVRALIQGLNSIIQAKDYESWSSALTAEYREHYSSKETLARISDAPVLKRQGIALRSLQDYFIHVVYPSRQNDRVDDIEFIDANRIRAITINAKGERLVLYNLEKIGDTWKIAIWR